MSLNGGITYCSSDYSATLEDFLHHIKRGIQTKGFEQMIVTKGFEQMIVTNLLICIGFVGKLTESNQTLFKVKTKNIVNLMANKGIRLLQPKPICPDQYAGLEWELEKFIPRNTLTPTSSIMYTNIKGRTSVRFTDYKEYTESDSQNNEDYSEN